MTLFGGRGFAKGMIIGLAVAGMAVPVFAQDSEPGDSGQSVDFPSAFAELQVAIDELQRLSAQQIERESRMRRSNADELQDSASSAQRILRRQEEFRRSVSEVVAGMAPSVSAFAALGPAASGGSYVLFLKDTLFPDTSGTKLGIGDFTVSDHGGAQTLGPGSGVNLESINGCPAARIDFQALSQAATVEAFTEIEGSAAEGISRVKSIQASAVVLVPNDVAGGPPHLYILNLVLGSATPGVNEPSGGNWTLSIAPGDDTCNGGDTFIVFGGYDFVNSVIAAPEPPLTVLLGTGLLTLYFLRRRNRVRLAS